MVNILQTIQLIFNVGVIIVGSPFSIIQSVGNNARRKYPLYTRPTSTHLHILILILFRLEMDKLFPKFLNLNSAMLSAVLSLHSLGSFLGKSAPFKNSDGLLMLQSGTHTR